MRSLSNVHLNGLRALEAVGRLGTLQAAAQELGVSSGAVSQQIIKAEKQLGRPVFLRTSRGLLTTDFGGMILPHLTGGFRELARGVAMARDRTDLVLTVSVAPVLAAKWLVPRLTEYGRQMPDMRVRIEAAMQLVDMRGSDIDVALRVGDGTWPDVQAELLQEQEVFPVCTPEMAQKLKGHRGILSLPVVVDANSTISWDLWLAKVGLAGQPMNVGYQFNDAALCLDATIAGQGLMLAWQTLACDAIASGRLVAPFRERARTGLGYWLVTAPDVREPAKVSRFKAWVRAEMKKTARIFEVMDHAPRRRI